MTLRTLSIEAAMLAGGNLCASGHRMESVGGRACPKGFEDCSQTVYECWRCGYPDFGDPGGPGHEDCKGCTR